MALWISLGLLGWAALALVLGSLIGCTAMLLGESDSNLSDSNLSDSNLSGPGSVVDGPTPQRCLTPLGVRSTSHESQKVSGGSRRA